MQVAFGASFFSFMYHTRDEERNPVEKKLRLNVQNHLVARSIFRTVTEEQVFFYQSTVSDLVLNHADDRHGAWKNFCRKVLFVRCLTTPNSTSVITCQCNYFHGIM